MTSKRGSEAGCVGCDDTFVLDLATAIRRDFALTVDISDSVLQERVKAGVHRAISRGAGSSAAISRFVSFMFALEPEFDERSRVREHFAARPESFDVVLLNMETDSHPNCWYRAEASFTEERWRALARDVRPHEHVPLSGSDDGDSRTTVPPQLSPNYGFQLDVPFHETPEHIVLQMLDLARIGPMDTVIDLGSGSGRMVIMAATVFGARGIGIDLNPENVAMARLSAERAGVSDRVTFRRCDLFDADLSDATVVTLYLLRHLNLALRSRLRNQLRPGARVVSRQFDMGDWQPDLQVGDQRERIYCWQIRESAA